MQFKIAIKFYPRKDKQLYLSSISSIHFVFQIDDYPEFLSPPDRETNQHIRIIYYSTVFKKECEKSKGVRKFLFPFHHANANNKKGM